MYQFVRHVSLKCYYKKDQRWTVHDSVDPKHKSESATSSPNCIKKKQKTNNKNQNKTSSSSSVHEYLNIFPLCKYWSSKNPNLYSSWWV